MKKSSYNISVKLVYSENEEKFLQHLSQVVSCLYNAGLTLNLFFRDPFLS